MQGLWTPSIQCVLKIQGSLLAAVRIYSVTALRQDCGWDAYDQCYYTGDRCHIMGKGSAQYMEASYNN